MIKFLIFLTLFTSLSAQNLFMGEVDDTGTIELLKNNTKRINDSNAINNRAKTEQIIINIFSKMQDQNLVIDYYKETIKNSQNKDEIKDLSLELAKELKNYDLLDRSLMQLSIGSINIKDLETDTKKEKVDLDKSIQDIFEPFAIMLTRFTKVPRKIENLNLDIQTLDEKIIKLDAAIGNLNSYKALSYPLQQKIDILANDYAQKRLLLLHRKNSLNAQLKKLQTKSSEPVDELILVIKSFSSTHGLTLLYALTIFTITNGFLFLLKNLLENFSQSKQRSQKEIFLYRLSGIVLSLISLLLSTILAIGVIYARSDWLILGIVIFILLIVLWSLKNTLPKYFQEMLLMLNVGIVRENEHVQFKGVPYIVEKISYHAILNNPLLSNARTRIPLSSLEDLSSRVLDHKENLFPTSVKDYVLIDKGYGQVIFQSPQVVELQIFGSAIKSYATSAFLAATPINISRNGFTINIEVELDYKHKNIIINGISKMLEKGVTRGMQHKPYGVNMNRLWVEYSKADLNAIKLKLFASFKGEGAHSYYNIDRCLRALILDECNKNAWKPAKQRLSLSDNTNLLIQ